MSNELLNVLLQFGPAAVLLIAAGAIMAAVVGAANAWAVAWFSARATRQLANRRRLSQLLVEEKR